MKRIFFKRIPLFVIGMLFLFSSCAKEDSESAIEKENIEVKLRVEVLGNVSNARVEYRTVDGKIMTESLISSNTWRKTFYVEPGFTLFLKTKGTLEGTITMDVLAKGENIDYNDDRHISFRSPSSFEIEIKNTL